jgi:predicted O-linked N-acetylglucosamine transferase (SPINDLY family)
MAPLSEALAIAMTHHRAGRLQLAAEIYRQILAVAPEHADALHLLGVIAHQSGQSALAEQHIRRAIELQPSAAAYHNNLGEVLRALGRLDEALASYQQAIALQPEYPAPHNNLGELWRTRAEFDQAVRCYRRAIALQADYAEAHNNLGLALEELGHLTEAVASYRRAIDVQPGLALAWNNLARALQSGGAWDDAVACYQQALALDPQSAGACNNLGTALRDQGQLSDALACYERARQLNPQLAMAHSNRLCTLRCDPAVTPAALAAAEAEFDQRFAAPLQATWQPHANSPDPDRPLRLGFISPAFSRGPIGSFLIRVLEHLDRAACAVCCYSDRTRDDALTARFQAASTLWRRTAGLNDEQLAAQIRDDRIDLLFDLTGHAPHNRLLVFARRPAPIQITWIDSVGSSGLAAMDYVLADARLIPPQFEANYAERVLRMPHSSVCYEPAAEAPAVGPLPAKAAGQVTFGSFNQPAKIHAAVIATWCKILRRVPGSRLVLKYRGLTSTLAQQHYRQLFDAHGIDAHRLELQPHAPLAQYLAEYGRIDVALDPFPHCGGLTTCDALWLGVPVVTCPGETFASRQSLSHLAAIGLTETIARDLDHYVDIAVRLATNLPHLAQVRAGLRAQMARSPLCDGPRFAADFRALLRDVWRRWVTAQG